MLDIQECEPAFWQLRVVECIRRSLETQIGARLLVRAAVDTENEVFPIDETGAWLAESLEDRRCVAANQTAAASQSAEFAQATEQIYSALQAELLRLSALLDDTDPPKQARSSSTPHFLDKLWTQVSEGVYEDDQHIDEEDCFERDELDGAQSYSFEAISFDDLNDECESACR